MIEQVEFSLKPRRRGFHLITQEVASHLPVLPEKGLLHLFVKHTSCALSINENYDPSVRNDMECIYNDLVKEISLITLILMKVRMTCPVMPNVV